MNPQTIIDSLDLNAFDCKYCDVRIEDTKKTLIQIRNFELESVSEEPSLGAFLRVYNNGRWFYCSTTDLENIADEIQALVNDSQQYSDENKNLFGHIKPFEKRVIRHESDAGYKIPMDERIAVCNSYLPLLKKNDFIKNSLFLYTDKYKVKYFKSSYGVNYAYDTNKMGIVAIFTMRDGEKVADGNLNRHSHNIESLKAYHEELETEIKETERFLDAEVVPPGKYRLVLDPEVTGVFAHESFGHKSEADFMLGDPKAKEAWKLGSRVGADILSIVDEGQTTDITGYAPFDDEGVESEKTYLIKKGILTGRLHSLSTAHELDEKPTGNARAISFEYEPIVRMTNTYVEPGDMPFEKMISTIKRGIFIKGFSHGSGLSTFTIAPRKSYWIEDGKITKPVKVSVISGTVFQTLKDIEACSDSLHISSSAFGGCGKNDQAPLEVSDGGPAIVIREMQVS